MLSGGSVFDNLDYSFAVGFENGSSSHKNSPGGGSRQLRKELSFLKTFFDKFDFVGFHRNENMLSWSNPSNADVKILEGREGREYAGYICETSTKETTHALTLLVNKERYNCTWWDTKTGSQLATEIVHTDKKGKWINIRSPPFSKDIAFELRWAPQAL